MLSFASDYIKGAHPAILEKLIETNMEPLSGYGTDKYCESAAERIKAKFECPDAEVFFLTGGTQTNQIIIDTMLEKYEGVVSATTGHVSAHEAGAIEYSGNEVLTIPGHTGKIDAKELENYVETFYADANHEHMVFPGMVYVSYPTEYGTLYTKAELEEIYAICKKYNMRFFIDGARLGYGIAGSKGDIQYKDIAKLCDVFYVGGTKVGALCGEAVVFTHNNMPKHFVNQVKKHGALIAKGRLLGVSFDVLFTDNLYERISENAISMKDKLIDIFKEKGYKFFIDSPTNQQFFVIDNEKLAKIKEKVEYGFWEKYDDAHTVVRFATAWSTTEEDIAQLKRILE